MEKVTGIDIHVNHKEFRGCRMEYISAAPKPPGLSTKLDGYTDFRGTD